MKKAFFLATVVSLSAMFIQPLDSQASSSIPTAQWDLYLPDGVSIDEGQAMHMGQYFFSAYINNYRLYSNYYFHVLTSGRYVMNCHEMFNVSDSYVIRMVNKNTGYMTYNFIGSSTHSFYHDYSNSTQLGKDAYFFIDGEAYNAQVSIVGYMDTY